jgi:hypothetical protein
MNVSHINGVGTMQHACSINMARAGKLFRPARFASRIRDQSGRRPKIVAAAPLPVSDRRAPERLAEGNALKSL